MSPNHSLLPIESPRYLAKQGSPNLHGHFPFRPPFGGFLALSGNARQIFLTELGGMDPVWGGNRHTRIMAKKPAA